MNRLRAGLMAGGVIEGVIRGLINTSKIEITLRTCPNQGIISGAIPQNYARFLNYATDRVFLQRIGGRYRFIHKLLQDHFAHLGE